MERFGTLIRENNVALFLEITNAPTLREAAIRSGMATRHALRLSEKWLEEGWLTKEPTLHGSRYFYTAEGASIASAITQFKQVMR